MNLYFKSITIVDLSHNEAKRVQFNKGKNLLTSEGNHYGKSVIMKSLYYTLGAEVFFPEPIKALRFLSIVSFKYGDTDYTVGRLKNNFVLYKGDKFVKRYNSVGSFGEALSSLLNLDIQLVSKDPQGTIISSPPAFLFLPYYIDQENGWSINSYSFDKMAQFDLTQRKDSYFFHLGVFDSSYVEKSKIQKSNQRKIASLENEQKNYQTVVETLTTGLNEVQMSFDVESLEKAITTRKNKINEILIDLAKVRSNLIETEDTYQHLINEKDIICKYLKNKKQDDFVDETILVECPQCGNVFAQSFYQKIRKKYLLESLSEDYSKLLEELQNKEKQITKLTLKYKDYQLLLSKYEKTLDQDQNVYDTYLRTKTTKNIVDEYHFKMAENQRLIEELRQINKTIADDLKKYSDCKTEVCREYADNFKNQIKSLDVPNEQISGNIEPGAQLNASGAYGPRCKIAQILTFLETQKENSGNTVSLPVVIDSPNVLEQDKNNLESVLKALLTWNITENQIIVASIEGKSFAEKIPEVNVITLNNPKTHIMSKEEFENYSDTINTFLSSF